MNKEIEKAKMPNLEEIKNKVAIKYGYKNHIGLMNHVSAIDEVAKEYASEVLNEVARRWHLSKLQRGYDDFETIDDIILNIKEELK